MKAKYTKLQNTPDKINTRMNVTKQTYLTNIPVHSFLQHYKSCHYIYRKYTFKQRGNTAEEPLISTASKHGPLLLKTAYSYMSTYSVKDFIIHTFSPDCILRLA